MTSDILLFHKDIFEDNDSMNESIVIEKNIPKFIP